MLVINTATQTLQCHISDPTPRLARTSKLSYIHDFSFPSYITFVLHTNRYVSFATAHHHFYLGSRTAYRSKRHLSLTMALNHHYIGTRTLSTRRMSASIANKDVGHFSAHPPRAYPLSRFSRLWRILYSLTIKPLHAITVTSFRLLSIHLMTHAIGMALIANPSSMSSYRYHPWLSLLFPHPRRILITLARWIMFITDCYPNIIAGIFKTSANAIIIPSGPACFIAATALRQFVVATSYCATQLNITSSFWRLSHSAPTAAPNLNRRLFVRFNFFRCPAVLPNVLCVPPHTIDLLDVQLQ